MNWMSYILVNTLVLFFYISVTSLTRALKWQDMCLVNKRLLLSASREKVWQNFHTMLTSNIENISLVTGSKVSASILSLHVMKFLVHQNYVQDMHVPVVSPIILSSKEEDVIAYIAGYILMRFKMNECYPALISDEATGFIAAKDRGGLTKPSPDFVCMVRQMEEAFRLMPLKSVERMAFHCLLREKLVPNIFFQLLDHVNIAPEKKEDLFVDMSNLFFVVRVHQKCRNFIEQHIQKTKISRKSKPLRDSF